MSVVDLKTKRQEQLREKRAGHIVQIRRRVGVGYKNGVVLGVSEQWLLLWALADFRFDGFLLLRLEDIEGVRCDAREEFFENVLKAEGRLRPLVAPLEIDLDSFLSALRDLKRHDLCLSIACEKAPDEAEREAFYTGKVCSLHEGSLFLVTMSEEGRACSKAIEIPYPSITALGWDTDTLNMLSKHGCWKLRCPKVCAYGPSYAAGEHLLRSRTNNRHKLPFLPTERQSGKAALPILTTDTGLDSRHTCVSSNKGKSV